MIVLKHLEELLLSNFVSRNIFYNIFNIFNSNWFKRTFSLNSVVAFNFLDTRMAFNSLMISISGPLVSSSSLKVHSKLLNLSTVSEKVLLRIIAISSFLIISFSFSTTSLLLRIRFSFSVRIILDSPWVYLLEKEGFYLFQNGLQLFDVSKFSKYSIFHSLFNLTTRFYCLL